MTTVDVLFRYAAHPSEAAMFALGKAHEVYGIRRLKLNAAEMTICVEYDATRLTAPVIAQLLRCAGLSITEQVSLIPPQPPALAAESAPSAAPAR